MVYPSFYAAGFALGSQGDMGREAYQLTIRRVVAALLDLEFLNPRNVIGNACKIIAMRGYFEDDSDKKYKARTS